MTLPLTPETLASAYDYLRTTPPFNRWNMPEGEDVKFIVGKFGGTFAQYQWDGNRHTVSFSEKAIGHSYTLLVVLSHEMIHMHLEETGMESTSPRASVHNAAFRKLAAQVCRVHGFDPKAFY